MNAKESRFGLYRLRRSSLWAAIVSILLAAQIGLFVHQLEHQLHPDVAAIADDCLACRYASALSDGPPTYAIAAPAFIELRTVFPAEFDLPASTEPRAGFQPRAPPARTSV